MRIFHSNRLAIEIIDKGIGVCPVEQQCRMEHFCSLKRRDHDVLQVTNLVEGTGNQKLW